MDSLESTMAFKEKPGVQVDVGFDGNGRAKDDW